MTVAYGPADAFTRPCAVYTCPCGRKEARYGRIALILPPGWVRIDRGGEPSHACPACASRIATRAAQP